MSGHSNILLSYGEAAAGNGLLTNLEAYWKLDESSGTIIDAHASYDSVSESATYSATGVINTCLSFNGTSDSIAFGDVLDFDRLDSFSFSLWYKPITNTTANHFIIVKQEPSGNFRGWVLWRNGSTKKLQFQFVSTGANLLGFSSTTLPTSTSTWYHIVCTYDGSSNVSGMNMYINGSAETASATQNSLTTTTVNAVSLDIGSRGAGQYSNAYIDEVGIWSRELSGTDVTALYNSGSGLAYSSFTS